MNNLSKKQQKTAKRICLALVIFFICELIPFESLLPQPYALWVEFAAFLVPYLMAGYDVLVKAGRNIVNGQVFDENFLMAIATLGAFGLVFFPEAEPHMAEGAAVMLFYQVGELFQGYAVGKSRKSIADMMDIAPDFANIMVDGQLQQVDPYEVQVGDVIVIKPGERVPLDGTVLEGASQLNTAALTGESIPRTVEPGSAVVSGCINLSGLLIVQVDKPFEQSTVQRILELVENASEKKARTENFITRFARYYTPIVVGVALLLAVIPPLVMGDPWSVWIQRGLIFLVVSCPCALVISVPLSFFGGIGAASRLGILVKGGNYLEALAQVDTVVFDKTGTLTTGTFAVVTVEPQSGFDAQEVLSFAAHAEAFSDHPIAASVRAAFEQGISAPAVVGQGEAAPEVLPSDNVAPAATGAAQIAFAPAKLDPARVSNCQEVSGKGVVAQVEGRQVLIGNAALLASYQVKAKDHNQPGTVLHVALDGEYAGYLVIADQIKSDAVQALHDLHQAGVTQTVMLTGDNQAVAQSVAAELGVDQVFAQLLPADKVERVEALLTKQGKGKLAFVGDGINDAPVLTRADVGIAMGAMGADAAIEAADIVLMDDRPTRIAQAIRLARKTMAIVWQNIVFALGVKVVIMVLAALGIANMWMAVFGDVGVSVIAILNAMRCLRFK